MRKSLLVTSFVFISLAFGTGCAKKTPEPETPATAQQSPPAAPTAPRPDPVADSAADTSKTDLQAHPVQIMVWTDDGLKQIAPGTVIALPKGERMVIHLYPQPAEGSLTFSGPMRLARQGGHAVLEFIPETERGTHTVTVRNGSLPEFPLQVEVR